MSTTDGARNLRLNFGDDSIWVRVPMGGNDLGWLLKYAIKVGVTHWSEPAFLARVIIDNISDDWEIHKVAISPYWLDSDYDGNWTVDLIKEVVTLKHDVEYGDDEEWTYIEFAAISKDALMSL